MCQHNPYPIVADMIFCVANTVNDMLLCYCVNWAQKKNNTTPTFPAKLSVIIANRTLGRKLTHQLEAYLSLMGRLESTARLVISSEVVRLTGIPSRSKSSPAVICNGHKGQTLNIKMI
jgi:hypothetical protein